MNFIYDNGDEVKDAVSGFKGIIRARADYLTGCNRYGIQDPKIKKGEIKPNEWSWFDEAELILIKKGKVKLPKHYNGSPLPANQLANK